MLGLLFSKKTQHALRTEGKVEEWRIKDSLGFRALLIHFGLCFLL